MIPFRKKQDTDRPKAKKPGLFKRLGQGLKRTREQLGGGLGNFILGQKVIDEDILEAIETQLLLADVGAEATTSIIDDLTARLARRELNDPTALLNALREELKAILTPVEQALLIEPTQAPFVILMVGVNGSGKTTTIAKLATRLQNEGKSVLLAAGDTFRAAAIEQLQVWGDRHNIPVIAQETGADSASVIFDAMQAAKARNIDVLIADTAGRLHTQSHLMDELKKVRRVLHKCDPNAPQEVMLVLDAGIGQNAINQAEQFNEAVKITGITLTKLDGTAKGGIIFNIAKRLTIPIRFIGIGEAVDDLRSFDATAFVEALFTDHAQEDRDDPV